MAIITLDGDDNSFTASVPDDEMRGLGATDTLTALANGAGPNGSFGADLLQGSAGDDLLNGGFGGNSYTLHGTGGDDTLIGKAERDLWFGGSWAYRFPLKDHCESGTSETTRDRITDFS